MTISNSTGQIVHHVFFWLKNPGDAAGKDELIAGITKLAGIETVQSLHVGTVASTEKRAVVDSSWDVSELILFADLEGQAVYQDHPSITSLLSNATIYGNVWWFMTRWVCNGVVTAFS